MRVQKINDHLHLVDLEPANFENSIASYVIHGEKNAIIETGPASTVPNLLKGLKQIGINNEDVQYIAVSHIHIDHAGGAGALMKHLPNAKLVVHPRGASHIASPEELWVQSLKVLGGVAEMYGKPEPVPRERIVNASNAMTINLGRGIELEVIETLGHASHHFSYMEKSSETIFPGDAGGIYLNQFDVIIPTTPPPFHLEATLASIDKLVRKNPKHLCYTHFGPAENAVEKLERYADQLMRWADMVADGVKRGESLEKITQHVNENDPAVKTAADYIRTHPIISRGIVKQNIQGFMEYFQKQQK